MSNYIVMTDNALILKNDIYAFTKKKFALKDITEMNVKVNPAVAFA